MKSRLSVIKNNVIMKGSFIIMLALTTVTSAYEQNASADTIHITLDISEQRFLKENLQLIASKFNISAAEAAIVQARLWSNPNFSFEQNIYNWDTHKYFDVTSSGNTGVQIQQLIVLAGKKGKQIELASINKAIAEHNFEDLLRVLKFNLHTDFYDLHFLPQSLEFYDESIPSLKKAISAIEVTYASRSILLSEILRLKSLLLSLESDRLGIVNQINDLEGELHVLLNESVKNRTYYVTEINAQKFMNIKLVDKNLEEMINLALDNRADYLAAKDNVQSEETNLSLQKSMAIPDLTIGGLWSRQGSYIPDYYALTFSIDLPIFNRNQGNIEVSKNTLEANKKMQEQTQLNIEKDVTNTYSKVLEFDHLYKTFDKKFTSDYKSLIDGMISNYEKRYITIIEFTDFYESYRNSVLQLNQLQNNWIDAIENLNYKVGIELIK